MTIAYDLRYASDHFPGIGTHTFCAFQRHVLPEGEPVLATLVYVDKNGKEQRQLYELKERC